MKVITYPAPADFWRAAGPLFTADPVRNTVAITVLARLLAGGSFGDTQPILLTVDDDAVDDDTNVIGAAFCTPPFPLNVSALPPRVAPLVADCLATNNLLPSGVHGMRPETEAFSAAWAGRTGAQQSSHTDQRLYRLIQLTPPEDVPGEPMLATAADPDQLVEWRIEFSAKADRMTRWTPEGVRKHLQDSIDAGDAYLLWWVDSRPVSMAAASAPRNAMSRISAVYTPKELRGHGYASAATAAASQWAVDNGADHVVLFTDLSNPTSNSIYQRIGFVPVGDALDVTFTPVRLP